MIRKLSSLLCLAIAVTSFAPARANLDGADWIFHHDGKEYRFKWLARTRGTPVIALADLVQTFHLDAQFDPQNFRVTLKNPHSGSTVTFHTHSKTIEGRLKVPGSISGYTIDLSKAPRFEGVRLCVPLDFADRALRPLLTGMRPSNPLVRSDVRAQITLDPGHGGNDYGASFKQSTYFVHEKDVTLSLAWELRRALEKRGLSVGMTREDDSYLALPERTRLANAQGSRLFVSLHLNADSSDKQKGFEVYVLSLVRSDEGARKAVAAENQFIPEDLSEEVDRALAELRAQANFEKSLQWAKKSSSALKMGGLKPAHSPVKSGPFYVLYGADMPSLLVEWGYLTHSHDRETLLSPDARAASINALADAIAREFKP
ncbi:MAG: N-acetylmuramoyl-L-alanine amidase [Bdellovibrionales bacterium]|nr:N-acetylmuramoyl-L-alanine amidase [Bdellovibrionales bacterium]